MKFGRVGASQSFVFKERESNNTTSAMDLTERIDDFYPYHVALSHHIWAKAFKKSHLKWFNERFYNIFLPFNPDSSYSDVTLTPHDGRWHLILNKLLVNKTTAMDLTDQVALSHHIWAKAFKKSHLNRSDSLNIFTAFFCRSRHI